MAQGYKNDVMTLPELCEQIYAGFGQWAVINLIKDRQDNQQLSDVDWKSCDGCEEWSPFYEEACLVCGGK